MDDWIPILNDIKPAISLWPDEWNPLKEYLTSLDKVYKFDIELVAHKWFATGEAIALLKYQEEKGVARSQMQDQKIMFPLNKNNWILLFIGKILSRRSNHEVEYVGQYWYSGK